jgi:hypothetical protein
MALFSLLEMCGRSCILPPKLLTILNLLCTGSVRVRPYPDYWTDKDVLLLRSETENAWDGMLYWRDITRILEVAVHWHGRRDIWVFEFVWVRISAIPRMRCQLMGFPQRFLPCNFNFPSTTAIYRQLVEFAIYSRS